MEITGFIAFFAVFLAMFVSAELAKKTAASFTSKIETTWQRCLVNGFAWGFTASLVGTALYGLLGLVAPFLSWLIFFTLVDFAFNMLRARRGQ